MHTVMHLLHELDAGLQVHTEIHKDPVDTFTFVLFLLKYEHVVVEELLQFLIGEIDAKLLEAVELMFLFFLRMEEGLKYL